MRQLVLHTVLRKLALDGVLRAAGAVAQRVAALHHKAGNNAVKGQSVIKAVVCKVHKVLNRDRRCIAVQLDVNRAVVLDGDLCMVLTDGLCGLLSGRLLRVIARVGGIIRRGLRA